MKVKGQGRKNDGTAGPLQLDLRGNGPQRRLGPYSPIAPHCITPHSDEDLEAHEAPTGDNISNKCHNAYES